VFWLCITTLSHWLKKLAPLFHPIRSDTKTNRDTFSRALRPLHVITSSFDWFTGLETREERPLKQGENQQQKPRPHWWISIVLVERIIGLRCTLIYTEFHYAVLAAVFWEHMVSW